METERKFCSDEEKFAPRRWRKLSVKTQDERKNNVNQEVSVSWKFWEPENFNWRAKKVRESLKSYKKRFETQKRRKETHTKAKTLMVTDQRRQEEAYG